MSVDRNILAIDTAFGACSVAIRQAAGPTCFRHEPMTTGHAERLFPLVQDVLDEAALKFHNLDAIAVTVGPGSFTGVRVGIAAARGLALATGLPTRGATSLAALARIAASKAEGKPEPVRAKTNVVVVQDARRGNVFVQQFYGSGRTPVSDARLLPATDLAAFAQSIGRSRVTGTASRQLLDAAAEAAEQIDVVEIEASEPTALALTEVDLLEMSPVRPLYLRPPDAKAQVGKSLLRQSQ